MAEAALRGVTKRFGATEAVSELTLHVADGEFVVLIGPTGAGKTTTLRLFDGLEPPSGRTRRCSSTPSATGSIFAPPIKAGPIPNRKRARMRQNPPETNQ